MTLRLCPAVCFLPDTLTSPADHRLALQSSQPDGRDASQAGQECFIKGYPGNTDANLPAGGCPPMNVSLREGYEVEPETTFAQHHAKMNHTELIMRPCLDLHH